MRQPEGYHVGDENTVCRLRRNLYGLKQSARVWNHKVDEVFKTNRGILADKVRTMFIRTAYERFNCVHPKVHPYLGRRHYQRNADDGEIQGYTRSSSTTVHLDRSWKYLSFPRYGDVVQRIRVQAELGNIRPAVGTLLVWTKRNHREYHSIPATYSRTRR